MHSELLHLLAGRRFVVDAATRYRDQRYILKSEGWPELPVVVEQAGFSLPGILVREVDHENIAILGDLEDVEIGLYVREDVAVVHDRGHRLEALAHLGGPASVAHPADTWSPEKYLDTGNCGYRHRINAEFLRGRWMTHGTL